MSCQGARACLAQLCSELTVLGTQVLCLCAPCLQLCCQVPARTSGSAWCRRSVACMSNESSACMGIQQARVNINSNAAASGRPGRQDARLLGVMNPGSHRLSDPADTGAPADACSNCTVQAMRKQRTCTQLYAPAQQQRLCAACPAGQPRSPAAPALCAAGPPAPSLRAARRVSAQYLKQLLEGYDTKTD